MVVEMPFLNPKAHSLM
jgi:hypothetical protein